MEFAVLESLDAVRETSDEWMDLFNKSLDPNPFVSPDWLIAWWESFAKPAWEMQFGILRKNGEMVAVAPLYVVKERRGGRVAGVLKFWANSYSNRIAFLVSAGFAGEATKELVASLRASSSASWDLADLGPVVLSDQTTQLLLKELRRGKTGCAIVERNSAPYRELPNSPELLQQSLGLSFKKSLRRKLNKAKRADARIEFTNDPQRLTEVVDISAETWQHQEGTGIASSQDVKSFYERIAKYLGETEQLQFAFLLIDDNPIAFEMNVTLMRTMYNLKVGYRRQYGELSPGIVLRHHVLCHAIESGFEYFDFLGVSEAHKLHWASGTRLHGNVLFAPHYGYWWCFYLFRYAYKPLIQKRFPWALRIWRRLRSVDG